MRRRIGFLSTFVALLLIFALPAATVSAATFTYRVQKNTCSTSGGAHGYGKVYFKVKLTEYGNSGANKFTFSAAAQQRNLGSSRWYTVSKYGAFKYTFPSNRNSYYYIRWYSYHPGNVNWHRIKVTMKVWHSGRLLAKRTIYSKSC